MGRFTTILYRSRCNYMVGQTERLRQLRNVAVCKEVAAWVRGDEEERRRAREEWMRLEQEIASVVAESGG